MLSDLEIIQLIKQKKLRISPFNKNNMSCASMDLSLSNQFARYKDSIDTRLQNFLIEEFQAPRITLKPQNFLLGMTVEKVSISSGYYGFVETRGNFARAGISVTCDDGHIDSGTSGHITLEIQNRNTVDVTLYAGDLLCQLFIFRLSSPSSSPYAGKYSNQIKPTAFIP